MKYTSAQAVKELRRLNDGHYALLAKENLCREFVASVGEDIESVRSAYDYTAVQAELSAAQSAPDVLNKNPLFSKSPALRRDTVSPNTPHGVLQKVGDSQTSGFGFDCSPYRNGLRVIAV